MTHSAKRIAHSERVQGAGVRDMVASASVKSVIPESAAGGCPESREKPYITGSRPTSAAGGLGRDDEFDEI